LFEAVVDATSSAASIRQHVEGCPACRERWALLLGALDAWRTAANADADAVFTDDRLARQRERIVARIGALARSTRVVPFPALRARAFGEDGTIRLRRWVSLAAAAGLLIGVGVGRLSLGSGQQPAPLAQPAASMVAVLGPARAGAPTSASTWDFHDDEQFLSELDELGVRSRSRIRELQAIDQLTPRFRTMTAHLR
jgi:hypothetical protein